MPFPFFPILCLHTSCSAHWNEDGVERTGRAISALIAAEVRRELERVSTLPSQAQGCQGTANLFGETSASTDEAYLSRLRRELGKASEGVLSTEGGLGAGLVPQDVPG